MSRTEPRGLLVTKEFSVAPTSGGMLRSLALAQELSRDYAMTVISPDGVWRLGPGEPLSQVPAEAGAGPQGERSGWLDLWTGARYRSISGVRTAGARLVDQLGRGAHGHYDVGLLDHTCLAGLADWIAVGCESLLVSMHNVESGLMSQRAAAASGPAALAMRAESVLLRRLERYVCGRYPVVVCTDADAATLGGAPVIVCRNGVFDQPEVPEASDTRETSDTGEAGDIKEPGVVFSGALDWEPNIEGVLWFASQVWPRVRARRPEATATIAGRHPGAAVRDACRAPGLTLLPDPPVMAEVLARHRIGVVPLLTGGGSRIKILEYLAAGLLVISTDLGASGLEDVPAQFARRTPTDPQALADALVEHLTEQQAGHLAKGVGEEGKRAADWVRAGYSWPVTVRPLLDFLRDRPAR